MLDFPFDDNLIYIIPINNEKSVKVIFESSSDKEKELDYSHVIRVDLSEDVDLRKWTEIIERVFSSNS